jgi:hypothetical protein
MRYKAWGATAAVVVVSGAAALWLSAGAGGHHLLGKAHVRERPTAVAASAPRASPKPDPLSSRYSFTQLAIAGASEAAVTSINASGTLAGDLRKGGRAFGFVDVKGQVQLFSLPYAGIEAEISVVGIDAAGTVVGDFVDDDHVSHGFTRTAAGLFAQFNLPEAGARAGEGTEIAGISPGGVLVGSYITAGRGAVGFIDDNHQVTSYRVPLADERHAPTQIDFLLASGEYGGFYLDTRSAAHGFYVTNGDLHTVNYPTAGYKAATGTILYGASPAGVLYGEEISNAGPHEGFASYAGRFVRIDEPHAAVTKTRGGTVVFAANSAGEIGGSYSYNAGGETQAFVGHPSG